ncbi:MAG: hypothetical protein ACE5JP_05155 [Candidatus Bipolaricaulia bacterium]
MGTLPKHVYTRLKQAFKAQLSVYRWRSLVSMILGLMVRDGRKTLTKLARLVSVSALSRAFESDGWPQPQIRSLRRKRIGAAKVDRGVDQAAEAAVWAGGLPVSGGGELGPVGGAGVVGICAGWGRG